MPASKPQGRANNIPCAVYYKLTLPLSPTYINGSVTESNKMGWIGIAVNGITLFGPEEIGNSNAVEGGGMIQVERAALIRHSCYSSR